MSERDFKGVWIDKSVWLDTRLNAIEKVILAEIDSLDGERGCWASNKYIAEFCQCSESKVSRAIAKLIDLGYIYLESFDGRERVLRSRLGKMPRQSRQNAEADKAKSLGNNISNNTLNNKEKESTRKRDTRTAYGEYGWVKLSEEEHTHLINKYGETEVQRAIDYVDELAQSNGNKYKWKDWNLVVRKCIRDGWGANGGKNGTHDVQRDYEPCQLNVTRL